MIKMSTCQQNQQWMRFCNIDYWTVFYSENSSASDFNLFCAAHNTENPITHVQVCQDVRMEPCKNCFLACAICGATQSAMAFCNGMAESLYLQNHAHVHFSYFQISTFYSAYPAQSRGELVPTLEDFGRKFSYTLNGCQTTAFYRETDDHSDAHLLSHWVGTVLMVPALKWQRYYSNRHWQTYVQGADLIFKMDKWAGSFADEVN